MVNKEKLDEHTTHDSSWKTEAEWRADNHYWMKHSTRIAIRILSVMTERKMTKEELAEKMGMSLYDELAPILQGKANLNLHTIGNFEKLLNIKLISIPEQSYNDEKK